MKKILLVTLQDNNNIGNRLQNYALQTVLENCGAKVTNLNNGYTILPGKKAKIRSFINKYLGLCGNKKSALEYKKYMYSQQRRIANTKFSNKYIHNIIDVTYENVYHIDWSGYDLAVVGSDQVWHKWKENTMELPYYYLEFMPENKRTSYAASFGFEVIPENEKENHIKGLNGMRYISCREKSGCLIAESITGKEAVHVLDPTLLLSAKEWRKIETDVTSVVNKGEKYLFIYFLGEITEEYQNYIKRIVSDRNLKVVDFLDFSNEYISKCGVEEFLAFIDNAEYIMTDSFHCTVFSILFDKDFTVFNRMEKGFERMYGRIQDLLQITGKTKNSYSSITETTEIISFQEMYEKSFEYINEIMEQNDIDMRCKVRMS